MVIYINRADKLNASINPPPPLCPLLSPLFLSLSLTLCLSDLSPVALGKQAGTIPFSMAAFLLLMLAALTMLPASDAAWCVCRSDMGSNVLQKTLDYACGAGADCSPIVQNGACYNPNTVLAHCSYAVNSYYQRKGQAQGACDFSGSATLSSTDPGSNGCAYPASSSAAGSSGTPTTTTTPPSNTPTSTTPTSTTPTGTTLSPPTSLTPPTFNPNTGTGTGTGGVLGGLGPSGTTSSFDSSGGTVLLIPSPNVASFFIITLLLASLFLARI